MAKEYTCNRTLIGIKLLLPLLKFRFDITNTRNTYYSKACT